MGGFKEEILEERYEEVKNGTAKFISFDEACRDIGNVDERTEVEKELQHKQFERINAETKEFIKCYYHNLLGYKRMVRLQFE